MNFASSDIRSGDQDGSQVSSTFTSSTPGIARTTSSRFCWIIGPTGQPIEVSVCVTVTVPVPSSTSTSYTSPSSTTSIPSSGSSTWRSTSTTSSLVGTGRVYV